MGFRLRQKIDASAATDDRMAPLPTIPGIDGPPIIEEGPPEPDIPEDKYNLWSVRIENVDGRVRQLWVDEFHFEGNAHVAGAFFLRPKRLLWVNSANATIHSGQVVLGDQSLLYGISGSVDCTVPPFDPRPPTGMEFFRFISGAVQVDAYIPSVRALDYYTHMRGSSAAFRGGRGMFHLDGELRSGVVRPLNATLTVSGMEAQKEAWSALGSVQVSAKTDAGGPSVWLARIAPFELRHAGTKSVAIAGTELRLNTSIKVIDVSRPAPDFEVHGDMPSAQVPNLRLVNISYRTRANCKSTGKGLNLCAFRHQYWHEPG